MTRSKTYDVEHDLHDPGNHLHAMGRWQKCIPGGWPSLDSAKRAAVGDHSWRDRPYRIVCVSVEANVVFTSVNSEVDQRA